MLDIVIAKHTMCANVFALLSAEIVDTHTVDDNSATTWHVRHCLCRHISEAANRHFMHAAYNACMQATTGYMVLSRDRQHSVIFWFFYTSGWARPAVRTTYFVALHHHHHLHPLRLHSAKHSAQTSRHMLIALTSCHSAHYARQCITLALTGRVHDMTHKCSCTTLKLTRAAATNTTQTSFTRLQPWCRAAMPT